MEKTATFAEREVSVLVPAPNVICGCLLASLRRGQHHLRRLIDGLGGAIRGCGFVFLTSVITDWFY